MVNTSFIHSFIHSFNTTVSVTNCSLCDITCTVDISVWFYGQENPPTGYFSSHIHDRNTNKSKPEAEEADLLRPGRECEDRPSTSQTEQAAAETRLLAPPASRHGILYSIDVKNVQIIIKTLKKRKNVTKIKIVKTLKNVTHAKN